MKIKTQLEQLQKAAPKRHATGLLYAKKEELKRRYSKVVLHTIFHSVEQTHMYRAHLFARDEAKTPQQWHDWFAEHLTKIHKKVLSGLHQRTQKLWQVQRIIGFTGGPKFESKDSARREALAKAAKNDKLKSDNASLPKKRHKAKS